MKVLAIVGSSRKAEQSGTYTLVERAAKATGLDYEIVHLRGKKINGCIACLGCVADNICKVQDDMYGLRDKIVEADGYIIGGANYFSQLNGLTQCFMERLYQFRHQEGSLLWGKLAVAIGVGGSSGQVVTDAVSTYLAYSFVETVATVRGQGAPSCFVCGHGETCKVGAVHGMYGPDYKITEESIPSVTKSPETMEAALKAGEELGRRLTQGHDRGKVTKRMQIVMMERFKQST